MVILYSFVYIRRLQISKRAVSSFNRCSFCIREVFLGSESNSITVEHYFILKDQGEFDFFII